MAKDAMTILGIGRVRRTAERPVHTLESLLARRETLLQEFATAVERSRNRRMRNLHRELRHVNELLTAIAAPPSATVISDAATPKQTYVLTSLFLHECWSELTADASEQLFFVTGADVAGRLVLTQRVRFAHDERTLVAVRGNPVATHQVLIQLESFGQRLLAHFHSHPGVGVDSTRPSGTDEKFQHRLESGGYQAVAAIFSRDGFVRFFRGADDFVIEIRGTGVRHVSGHTYHLAIELRLPGAADSPSR